MRSTVSYACSSTHLCGVVVVSREAIGDRACISESQMHSVAVAIQFCRHIFWLLASPTPVQPAISPASKLRSHLLFPDLAHSIFSGVLCFAQLRKNPTRLQNRDSTHSLETGSNYMRRPNAPNLQPVQKGKKPESATRDWRLGRALSETPKRGLAQSWVRAYGRVSIAVTCPCGPGVCLINVHGTCLYTTYTVHYCIL